MLRAKTTTALAITAGALTLGAGIGVASLASANPTTTPTAPSSTSPSQSAPTVDPHRPDFGGLGGHHGFGGPRGLNQQELAQQLSRELGVSQDKVAQALQQVRDENRPATPGSTRPDPAERKTTLAKALSDKLGVDQAKVKSALQKFRTAERAEHAAALKTRLDAAVKAGTLTQTEADAVTKAYDIGVINVGRR